MLLLNECKAQLVFFPAATCKIYCPTVVIDPRIGIQKNLQRILKSSKNDVNLYYLCQRRRHDNGHNFDSVICILLLYEKTEKRTFLFLLTLNVALHVDSVDSMYTQRYLTRLKTANLCSCIELYYSSNNMAYSYYYKGTGKNAVR